MLVRVVHLNHSAIGNTHQARCALERMQLQEIKKKYHDKWVLLIEPETDEVLSIYGLFKFQF